jgi:hypothetical protein
VLWLISPMKPAATFRCSLLCGLQTKSVRFLLGPDHRKKDDGRVLVPPRSGRLVASHPFFERKSDYCAQGVPPVAPTLFTDISAQLGEYEIAVASVCFSHPFKKESYC